MHFTEEKLRPRKVASACPAGLEADHESQPLRDRPNLQSGCRLFASLHHVFASSKGQQTTVVSSVSSPWNLKPGQGLLPPKTHSS